MGPERLDRARTVESIAAVPGPGRPLPTRCTTGRRSGSRLSLRPADRSDRGRPCERSLKFRDGGDVVALQGASRGLSARILMADLGQAAGQSRAARRHHRDLRSRVDHQTTARARAGRREPDRVVHGPEDPDAKPAQACLSRLQAIPCQPARAASMGSQTRLPTRGSTGLHVTYLRSGAQNQIV